jgi:hypothetical protein
MVLGCKHRHCLCLDCRDEFEIKDDAKPAEDPTSIRQEERIGVSTALLIALREILYKDESIEKTVREKIYRHVWVTAVNSEYITKYDLEFKDDI